MKKITFFKLLSTTCFFLLFSLTGSAQNMALDFDGTAGLGGRQMSGQLIRTQTMIPFDDTFTIVTYIKVKSENSNIFVWGCTSVNNYLAFDIDADYKLRVRIPETIGESVISLSSLDTGWHQISVVSDEGNVSIYVDGVPVVEDFYIDFSKLAPTISSFGTGSYNGFWEGAGDFLIQNFGVLNVPLSEEEINDILSQTELEAYLDAEVRDSESGVVLASYSFATSTAVAEADNTSINFVQDQTGNYHGELHGFPLTGSTGNWVNASQSTLSSGLDDLSNNISVYPNPAKDYVKLSNITDETAFNIYNVLGTKVLSNRLAPEQKIDISPLSNGVYFIKLNDNRTLKFLKN